MNETLRELVEQRVDSLVRASAHVDTTAAKRDGVTRSTCDSAARKTRFAKLSILIPAYNEEATLHVCIDAVMKAALPQGLSREIILVDDASKDATWQVAQRLAE